MPPVRPRPRCRRWATRPCRSLRRDRRHPCLRRRRPRSSRPCRWSRRDRSRRRCRRIRRGCLRCPGIRRRRQSPRIRLRSCPPIRRRPRRRTMRHRCRRRLTIRCCRCRRRARRRRRFRPGKRPRRRHHRRRPQHRRHRQRPSAIRPGRRLKSRRRETSRRRGEVHVPSSSDPPRPWCAPWALECTSARAGRSARQPPQPRPADRTSRSRWGRSPDRSRQHTSGPPVEAPGVERGSGEIAGECSSEYAMPDCDTRSRASERSWRGSWPGRRAAVRRGVATR